MQPGIPAPVLAAAAHRSPSTGPRASWLLEPVLAVAAFSSRCTGPSGARAGSCCVQQSLHRPFWSLCWQLLRSAVAAPALLLEPVLDGQAESGSGSSPSEDRASTASGAWSQGFQSAEILHTSYCIWPSPWRLVVLTAAAAAPQWAPEHGWECRRPPRSPPPLSRRCSHAPHSSYQSRLI
jgi:hypothetical protein